MPIEGPLRELGIHDVFQLLDLSRKTGVLRVTSELRHNAGTISFEGGAIIFAEIRSNPHPLGALLLRTGKISEADLERARDMQGRQGDRRRLGEILVSLGALSPRELERQVRFQIEEVVFEVMSWREGYFSFSEGPPSELPTDATVRIPTEALLMEGARRIDEWSRIEGRIPHLGVVPMLAPPQEASEGELDLLPPEWEMLAMINGTRDVRAIASELGRSDFEVAKTLFGLESAGVIVLADPGTTKRERTTLAGDLAELVARAEDAVARRDLEQARDLAQQAAGVHPHDPTVHLLLGRIALASGRGADAVEELRRALRLDPLAAAAHRVLGYALAATGRFGEAVEQWDQWERLAGHSETELALLDEVHRAKAAAQTLAGTGTHGRRDQDAVRPARAGPGRGRRWGDGRGWCRRAGGQGDRGAHRTGADRPGGPAPGGGARIRGTRRGTGRTPAARRVGASARRRPQGPLGRGRHRRGGRLSRGRFPGGGAYGQAPRAGQVDRPRRGRTPRPCTSRAAHGRRAAARGARPRGSDGAARHHRAARRPRGAPLAGGARVTAASAGYGKALDLITRVRGARGSVLVSVEGGRCGAAQ